MRACEIEKKGGVKRQLNIDWIFKKPVLLFISYKQAFLCFG